MNENINNDMGNNMNITIMIMISFIAGYLSTMNLWTVNIKHVRWHINDFYMVMLMASLMILLDYLVMHNYTVDVTILIIVSIIIITLFAIRTQFLVDDKQFLNGMIPHHSMAILMSREI